jgi:hypothetical protein
MVDATPIEELEQGLLIDEDALDEALFQQPDLFYRVSKQLALSVSYRDQTKQEKEDTEARVDAQLRHDAEIDDEKITEKEIESQKRLNKDVQKAARELLRLNKEVGSLTALKESFQQRSFVLNKLVDLYTAGYFGDANHSRTVSKVKDYDHHQARQAMNKIRRQK